MDVKQLITELRSEREEIERAIRSVEEKRIHLVAKRAENDIDKAWDGPNAGSR